MKRLHKEVKTLHNTQHCIVAKSEHVVTPPPPPPPVQKNITLLRRRNLLALYQEFARARLAADPSGQGLEQAFAKAIEVSPSTWSMIKSARAIGDKLARQIEQHQRRPAGWLDEEHPEFELPDGAEEAFIRLARRAWRRANAKGKRDLRQLLKPWAEPPEAG
ncbi:hypothetical protein [Ramlibacter sp. AN1133]|uniref:hypothetical protein n=1 Tax=Ramlibacter sp. AN1133 TaxID=3133429 RepID=UPI0030BFA5D5